MILKIIHTILRYPIRAKVTFEDPVYGRETKTVSGYMYSGSGFYVLFLEGGMIHRKRLPALAVSVDRKGGIV